MDPPSQKLDINFNKLKDDDESKSEPDRHI